MAQVTVIINEAAIAALLETREGFGGRVSAAVAARVVNHAQQNVAAYFASAPTLNVQNDIDFDMHGSHATIGIRDAGRKAERIARDQQLGKFNWLRNALESSRA